MDICCYFLVIFTFLHIYEQFSYKMMLEFGGLGVCPQTKFLLNFQDLELKKKILQRILLSTVVCMYTGRTLWLGGVRLNLPEAVVAAGQTWLLEILNVLDTLVSSIYYRANHGWARQNFHNRSSK